MADALQRALPDQVDPQSLLTWLAVVGVIYWRIRTSPGRPIDVVGGVVVSAIIGLACWLAETYDLRSAVKSLALGGVATSYGAVLFVVGGVPMAVSVGLLVVGAWLLFDAVQVVRHDGLYADGPRDGRAVYRDYVARKVDYALRDRPRTRRELCEELDADEAAIDDALATLDEQGVLSREGSELRTSLAPDDEASGSVARAQRAVRKAIGRLARPVTIELER